MVGEPQAPDAAPSRSRDRPNRGARLRGALLALACCLPAGAFASSAAPLERAPLPDARIGAEGFSSTAVKKLEHFLEQATGDRGYLGAVSLIARNGRIVEWRAYGHRDLARRVPLRKDAIFRLYSMTKTVTSVAVLMLAEEGKLALDDPLSRYLPEFADPQVMVGGDADMPQLRPARSQITLHALLTHTAGFPAAGLKGDAQAVKRMQRVDPHGAADLRGFAERLSRVPLAADPDTRFGYDGAALEVLARVVEVAGGQPFDTFLERRLFAPLAMHDTGFRVPQSARTRVIDLTTMSDDGRLMLADGRSAREPGAPLNTYASGAGGLYSTAADFARLCQMLLDGGALDGRRILKRETVASMMHNHLTMKPPVTQFSDSEGFGIGGYVVLDVAGRDQAGPPGRFGWAGAASTTYTIDRENRLQAILLLQHLPHGERDLPRLSRDFYRLVYEGLRR